MGLLALVVALLSQVVASMAPDLVERWYARWWYPPIARGLQASVGSLPFSLAESLLLALTGLVLGWSSRAFWSMLRGRTTLAAVGRRGLRLGLTVMGPGYLLFLVLWGFHYQRPPLAHQLGLEASPPQAEDLAELAAELLPVANRLRASLAEDTDGVMRLRSRPAVLDAAPLALRAVTPPASPAPARGPLRRAWISPIMSRLGITGIFIPFTGEAHLNDDFLDAGLPFVACHELAHQAGHAHEDEANFLAYLACREHADPQFRYAGALIALRILLGRLAVDRPDLAVALAEGLSEPVRRDWTAFDRFWLRHSGPMEVFSEAVQDTYLRAQGTADGVRSYGRMVDLMVAERRARRD